MEQKSLLFINLSIAFCMFVVEKYSFWLFVPRWRGQGEVLAVIPLFEGGKFRLCETGGCFWSFP